MFDDQNQNSGQVPGNLPISNKEPEDIFSSTESKAPDGEPAVSAEMEATQPIPPATPSALEAGALRPKEDSLVQENLAPQNPPLANMPASEPSITTPPVMPDSGVGSVPMAQDNPATTMAESDYQIKSPSVGKSIFVIIGVILVVAILGGGGWFIYSKYIQGQDTGNLLPAEQEETTNVFLEETANNLEVEETVGTEESENGGQNLSDELTDESILFGEPIDKDGDGLSDSIEDDLGTDPNNWDTDGDELGDGDEALTWNSDPLNPDTDGDGYADGEEIRNGYNPLGPGRIFEPPKEDETTSTQG